MNSQIANLALSLGGMQIARKIPMDSDPQILLYVRVGYVTAQLLCLAVYYYTSIKIKQKNDQTVLKYVEPKNPMSTDSGGLVTTTVRDYDLAEVSKLVRGVYMGVAMMAVLHLYMKFNPPLFVQALTGLKGIYDAKPVQIHLFGKPATGDLKRPFKVGGMFGAAADPATDAASIKEAESKPAPKKDE